MTTIILQFPSSPQVIVVAEEIIKSSVTVCTTEEISMIEEEVSSMDEALEEIEEALEAVQEQIEGLMRFRTITCSFELFSSHWKHGITNRAGDILHYYCRIRVLHDGRDDHEGGAYDHGLL